MNSQRKSCPTCKCVNTIYFWGDRPQKQWKRPVLFVLSIVMLVGGGYIFSINEHPSSQEPFTLVLLALMVILFILGLVVSVFGCNHCVAKLFGDV